MDMLDLLKKPVVLVILVSMLVAVAILSSQPVFFGQGGILEAGGMPDKYQGGEVEELQPGGRLSYARDAYAVVRFENELHKVLNDNDPPGGGCPSNYGYYTSVKPFGIVEPIKLSKHACSCTSSCTNWSRTIEIPAYLAQGSQIITEHWDKPYDYGGYENHQLVNYTVYYERICGDGICAEGYETYESCPADCEAPKPPETNDTDETEDNDTLSFCGDAICQENESCENCPIDCGECTIDLECMTDSDCPVLLEGDEGEWACLENECIYNPSEEQIEEIEGGENDDQETQPPSGSGFTLQPDMTLYAILGMGVIGLVVLWFFFRQKS